MNSSRLQRKQAVVTALSRPKPVRRKCGTPFRSILVALAVGVGAACTDPGERPTEAEWITEWEQRRELIPDADSILDGGRELCDELDGQLRVSLPELLPSPYEILDDPVGEWTSHAVSLVFECSADESTIVEQLETLDFLAAEVDGGLQDQNS